MLWRGGHHQGMGPFRSVDPDDLAGVLGIDLETMPESASRRRSDKVFDFLGATKPLHLIAGACAVIALIAIVAEWIR